MIYSMDTSALIDAWVRFYPPDVFATLWDRIDEAVADGRLIATDEVLHELEPKEDDLYAWAKQRHGMFVPLDTPIQERAIRIINDHGSLTTADATRGAADPFVIALAAVREATVVTAERSKPTQPRIPDVCQALGIPCINLVQLFREEGWRV